MLARLQQSRDIGTGRHSQRRRVLAQLLRRASRHRLVRGRHVLAERGVLGAPEAARMAGDPLVPDEDRHCCRGQEHVDPFVHSRYGTE
jgi:hypothetical protein